MSGNTALLASVSGRYARALFDLAHKAGSHDAVASALDGFLAALDDHPDLKRLVDSPVFSRSDQVKAMGAVLGGLKIDGLTANFLGTVARNGRLDHIRDMVAAYHSLLAADRGETTAEVTSAQALGEAQLSKLQATLNKLTGRDVQIMQSVDASLLGGLVVKLGSRMYDNSLRTKLFNLQRMMKEVG
ncbi:MAG: F0F1 ATP synthase subunit delta [Hyphomicrobiales bacterium]|nr:MAG: F0F1 ATP synthase subunit delta [Hyphomicrobiales bacterium]